jgi:hypothetical protein
MILVHIDISLICVVIPIPEPGPAGSVITSIRFPRPGHAFPFVFELDFMADSPRDCMASVNQLESPNETTDTTRMKKDQQMTKIEEGQEEIRRPGRRERRTPLIVS